MKELDLEKCKSKKLIKIGELTPEIIKLLELNEKPKNIKIWTDRISHCEKHKKDFSSEVSFTKSINSIPLIIQSPDYVGLHPDGSSLQYIKRIDDITLVGIRIKSKGDLFFRTLYPITEDKLKYYIQTNRIKKISKETN